MKGKLLTVCLLASVAASAVWPLGTPAAAASAAAADSTGKAVAAVAEKVKPSVVGILNMGGAGQGTYRSHSAGTGFVYKDGVIVTNAHVVDKAAELLILYADKTTETVMPDQVFLDKLSDVAVIKVETKGLVPLAFADSDKLSVGENVIAIGNPLGFRLGNSVNLGILSGTGRALGSGYPFLQTDAAINPGNSGGPLVNLQGKVIGINSAKMADIGVEGLGFAIPANTAIEIADKLIKDGSIDRATLGIQFGEGWEAYFGVPDREGVEIYNVINDGPAGMTALRAGDKLIKLDRTPIYTEDDVYAFLLTKKPGDTVKITVQRNGQTFIAEVVAASMSDISEAAGEQVQAGYGILKDLTSTQIREAAEFGRAVYNYEDDINEDYVAISGGAYAVLYTEYLYIARLTESMLNFGYNPGMDYIQKAAQDINNKVEFLIEVGSGSKNFLNGAQFTLRQGSTTIISEKPAVTYTTDEDEKTVIAIAKVRFDSRKLKTSEPITLTLKTRIGQTLVFNFDLKKLK
ncbi:S1C family serine protease [Paenibacillus thermotolerans]|uniref:S1C family serine protease n=1 Tax=Paenibacillus thermotolerans TaxID=3027807 RepID=UPI002368C485|nr:MULTISPECIES: trypsin-like peptidase domain-containing protein [unclassified Paenibacillus]